MADDHNAETISQLPPPLKMYAFPFRYETLTPPSPDINVPIKRTVNFLYFPCQRWQWDMFGPQTFLISNGHRATDL